MNTSRNWSPRLPGSRGCRALIRVALIGVLAAAPLLAQAQQLSGETVPRDIAPKLPGADGIVSPEAAPTSRSPRKKVVEQPGDREQLVAELRGVVFVSSPGDVMRTGATGVKGVKVETDDVLNQPAFENLMQKYLGEPVSLLSLKRLNRDVVRYYAKHDYPVVNVVIPEQDITNGVVQFVVVKGHLAQIRATGNEHFTDKLLTDQVHIQKGSVIRGEEVRSHVRWLNRNPFRHVDLVYTPGKKPGQTDVILRTRDRRPYRFYGGFQDSGNRLTGEERWFVGVNWGSVFGSDSRFNYQYTFNNDPHWFQAHSASYILPLKWHHVFSISGSYAETHVKPGKLGSGSGALDLAGESSQISLRYTIPLPRLDFAPRLSQEVSVGYDWKSTNNNLQFGGIQVIDNTVDISQFLVNYSASLPDDWGRTNVSATFVHSPGGMMADNNDSDFRQFNPNADAEYTYARFKLRRVQKLPYDFSLYGQLTAQVASDTLLGSEQLGAGGYGSVRGYEARVVNGDNGVLLNTELRTPSMNPLYQLGLPEKDSLQFLAFWDYAHVVQKNGDPDGSRARYRLSSAGLGLRYALPPYLTFRLDYGWQLRDNDFDTAVERDRDSRVHIGLVVAY